MELVINLPVSVMKAKLFLAFSGIIFIGLVSNIIFAFLIYRDFNAYSTSLREDQLGWVRSSIETGYSHGRWNKQTLVDALHWGLMLGFYIKIYDSKGNELLTSEDILPQLHHEMRKRMEGVIDLKRFYDIERTFEIYSIEDHLHESPEDSRGVKIGRLTVRTLIPWGIARLKEEAFKEKLSLFLGGSIIFVALASFLTAYLLSHFISKPFIKLKSATERLTEGDLSVRIDIKGKDEISSLAESFNRMAERLEREDDLRRHLSSQLTHELRTPLTILRANMDALKDGIIDHERALKNMEPELQRLQGLIEGMEEIVRAESSLFTTVRPRDVELYSLIKNSLISFEQEFLKKGLYLKIEGESVYLRTDPEKVTIILRNLLQNSLRFTEKGGATIFIKGKEKDCIIEVADTGRGIEPSRLPFIFKRFYKDEKSSGLGVGLSIVDGLVRLLGGTIEVESTPGKGTLFRIIIRSIE